MTIFYCTSRAEKHSWVSFHNTNLWITTTIEDSKQSASSYGVTGAFMLEERPLYLCGNL